MTQITYPSDKTGSIQIAQGSDGRLNVSARTDDRAYYNSRDNGRCFTWTSEATSVTAGLYTLYLQNTSPTTNLVIHALGVSADQTFKAKLAKVTGTAAGGSSIDGVNANYTSSSAPEATARGDGSITGLTPTEVLAVWRGPAHTITRLEIDDIVILGQNDAIAIEIDAVGASASVDITLLGYFE